MTSEDATVTRHTLLCWLLFKIQLESFCSIITMVFKQVFQISAGSAATRDVGAARNVERELAGVVVLAKDTASCVPRLAKGCNTVAVVHGKALSRWRCAWVSST